MPKYTWHLSGEGWHKVMEKTDDEKLPPKSIAKAHERFLHKNPSMGKSKRTSGRGRRGGKDMV